MEFSIIHYHGKQTNKCGYCKGTECSIAHGMHAYNMSPQDYQDLIDRGWRRSGSYCYKPHNSTTCCPSYTIKCDAQAFQLSKSHKKVLRRMNRFLRDGKKDKNEMNTSSSSAAAVNNGDPADVSDDGEGCDIRDELPQGPNVALRNVNLEAVATANPSRHEAAIKQHKMFDEEAKKAKESNTLTTDGKHVPIALATSGSKQSLDSAKPPCKKAKQIRLERRNARLAAKGIDPATVIKQSTTTLQEKTLREYIAESEDPSNKHTLKLKLLHVESKQFASSLSHSYAMFQKYQTRVHNDPSESVQEYLDFLKSSPLQYTKTHRSPPTTYGSFHQQYWLDDKLIAVAVIDILPYCVSSVYFFYDPDYRFLSLGTYGSLREINFVQELAANVPALKYYYMGFYIHSCPKMRYKGKLHPSYLLCPETYTWNLLVGEMCAKLNANKYQRLHPDPTVKDANDFLEDDLDGVLLLMEDNNCISYRQYIQSCNIETPLDKMLDMIRSRIYKEITGEDDERDTILEYGRLVGKTCAHRMLYFKV